MRKTFICINKTLQENEAPATAPPPPNASPPPPPPPPPPAAAPTSPVEQNAEDKHSLDPEAPRSSPQSHKPPSEDTMRLGV